MFKYDLSQMVKVQVFDLITEGEITIRIHYETSLGTNNKYEVYIKSIDDYISVWEQDLDFVQKMNIGDIVE
ncbi:hypothetical protein [Pseudoalteromonas phage PH357]|nr:hypothetical protein [Pseudoalteromonas phage PH357]